MWTFKQFWSLCVYVDYKRDFILYIFPVSIITANPHIINALQMAQLKKKNKKSEVHQSSDKRHSAIHLTLNA